MAASRFSLRGSYRPGCGGAKRVRRLRALVGCAASTASNGLSGLTERRSVMPEFGDMLDLIAKLRLGVPQHDPRALARMLADAKYTFADADDIVRLFTLLSDIIEEIHGTHGRAAFEREYAIILQRRSRRA
jgi:hypothetical protein